MEAEELRRCLMGLVRVGRVMDTDQGKRLARVKFDSEGFTSGWLHVIQHSEVGLHIEPDAQHKHTIIDTFTGGGDSLDYPAHDHPGSFGTYWMPKVNETVLCLYVPTEDGAGDGYIVGGIK